MLSRLLIEWVFAPRYISGETACRVFSNKPSLTKRGCEFFVNQSSMARLQARSASEWGKSNPELTRWRFGLV